MTLADYRKQRGEPLAGEEEAHGGEAHHPSALEYIQIGVILTVITAVEVASLTAHNVVMTDLAPASRNARAMLRTPSWPRVGPTAVSQADNTTTPAFSLKSAISRGCKRPSSPAAGLFSRTRAARSGNFGSANA